MPSKTSRHAASLMDQAHGMIKNRILRGEITLGDGLSRRKLAAELGMSFLPVSLALLRLEYEGFVESRPRAGTRVRIPSRDDIRGHYVVREALEVQSARLFALMATEKDIAELRELAARIDNAPASNGSRLEFLSVHQRFHKRIADVAKCPALSTTIDEVLSLESTWLTAANPQPELVVPRRRHQELVDALAQGDPDVAAEGMRRHIEGGVVAVMKGLKEYFAKRNRAFVRRAVNSRPTANRGRVAGRVPGRGR